MEEFFLCPPKHISVYMGTPRIKRARTEFSLCKGKINDPQ